MTTKITDRIKKDLVRRISKFEGNGADNYYRNILRIIIAHECPYTTLDNETEIDLNSIPDDVIRELIETVEISEQNMEYMKRTTSLIEKTREQVDKQYAKKVKREKKEKEKQKEKKTRKSRKQEE